MLWRTSWKIISSNPALKSCPAKYSTKVPKSYSEVPSPAAWPILGHAHLFGPKGESLLVNPLKMVFIYLPGPYSMDKLSEAVDDLSKQLGPTFKLNFPGTEMLVCLDPEDARSLFQHEGLRPFRPTFPALEHFRKKTFGSCGIVPG